MITTEKNCNNRVQLAKKKKKKNCVTISDNFENIKKEDDVKDSGSVERNEKAKQERRKKV